MVNLQCDVAYGIAMGKVDYRSCFNSLASERCSCNLKLIIFKLISVIDIFSISTKIILKWMSQDFADDRSTLVQVVTRC